jgi:hypothetical protein
MRDFGPSVSSCGGGHQTSMLHWLKTVVVSDTEKAPREGVR